MNQQDIKKRIVQGRAFMHSPKDDDFVSDQDLKKPQPPLVKTKQNQQTITLPKDFDNLNINLDFTTILNQRKSSRVYTQETFTLLQLSYLLWASQGIKDIRGKSYATLRTVPSGGARHGFETYLAIQNVEGIEPGIYHYLPLTHELEYLNKNIDPTILSQSLCQQSWAKKANVIFYWSCVAYRCEWRYGIHAHRVALIDAGHVCQNLYLACSALNLGTCAIAAFDDAICNDLFHLDGQEEFIVYTAPVGTIHPHNQKAEQAFYQFVKDENL